MSLSVSVFLQQTLQNPVLYWFFVSPLVLILLDVATGIAAAVLNKRFTLTRIGVFLSNDVEKYFLVSFVVVVVYLAGGIMQATAVATTLGMGTLALHIGASIMANVMEIQHAEPALAPVIQEVEQMAQPLLQKVEEQAQQLPIDLQPTTNQKSFTLPISSDRSAGGLLTGRALVTGGKNQSQNQDQPPIQDMESMNTGPISAMQRSAGTIQFPKGL